MNEPKPAPVLPNILIASDKTTDAALVKRLLSDKYDRLFVSTLPDKTVEDFEQRIADLSVDHAAVVQHYRSAHALHEANRTDADTEQLRLAIVHYRALFAELLGTPAEAKPDSRRWQPANA